MIEEGGKEEDGWYMQIKIHMHVTSQRNICKAARISASVISYDCCV